MLRLPRKFIYILIVLKTCGEVSKQPWASINHLIGQKKGNGSINHNCYDTEHSVHIRCNGTSKCHKIRENQVCCFSSEMYTVYYYSFSTSSTITNLFVLSRWKEQFLVSRKGFYFLRQPRTLIKQCKCNIGSIRMGLLLIQHLNITVLRAAPIAQLNKFRRN